MSLQTFDINKIKDLELNKKKNLIIQALTKIIEDKDINSSLKKILLEEKFNQQLYSISKEIIKRTNEKNVPSLAYLKEKYHFYPLNTEKTQHDLYEQLKATYLDEKLKLAFYQKMNDPSSFEDTKKLRSFYEESISLISELEEVEMACFGDERRIGDNLEKLRSKANNVYFGAMRPFNYLSMKTGQLIGVLGASGHGKSWTLQKLHAESREDVVLHFSLELSEAEFLKRIYLCLGWITEDMIENLNEIQLDKLKRKIARTFPDWYYLCLDTDSSIINLSKIEKLIKYYRKIYPDRVIKVFIDYVQLLEENFDPMNCRVNKYLHDMAVRYNVCIIEGIQANDEGTKYASGYVGKNGEHNEGRPPELSHIAMAKALKCDCDIIISQRSKNLEHSEDQETMLEYETKKHRNNKAVAFKYMINTSQINQDSWHMIFSSQRKNKHINYQSGEHDLFPDDEIINKEVE